MNAIISTTILVPLVTIPGQGLLLPFLVKKEIEEINVPYKRIVVSKDW